MGLIDGKGRELVLDAAALKAKADEARSHALVAIYFAGSGHPGGSLSAADIETALYFNVAKSKPSDPNWGNRDRVFISGQHKCPIQYALLGLAGYYPLESFDVGLRKLGTPFQGHPDWRKLAGIELSGGSLGQGLGAAVGDALAAKLDGKNYRVYCLMGDGEQQEGSIWEAVMAAAQYGLDNLCAIVDENGLQIDGRVCEVMNVDPLADKYAAFGWNAVECDGHDPAALLNAFAAAAKTKGKPSVIVAKTVKGKGVSFMENKAEWHGKAPNREQTLAALQELGWSPLFTSELEAKADAAKKEALKKVGTPASQRPDWWNAKPDSMRAEMKANRLGFGEALQEIGGDERIVCIGADISDSIRISDFYAKNPERKKRFFSAGIAEQNMTSMAAGLAKEGKIPIIGSYGVFATGRNWDHLRTTVCYGNLNVKIAVAHGGVSVGPDGATHQALEDITLTTILPNMVVTAPCDAVEAARLTKHIVLNVTGPAAVRLAREATPVVTTLQTPLEFGKATVFRYRREAPKFADAFEARLAREYRGEGEDAAIVACGTEVPEALRAAYLLKRDHGVEARVLNIHTLKPFDTDAIVRAATETRALLTVEEHQIGGLSALASQALALAPLEQKPAVGFIGLNDEFGESGQPWELVCKFGLAAEEIASAALALLKKK